MPTPVPWPAALDYAVEDPWREQPDGGGPTDSRLGLNSVSLLASGVRLTSTGSFGFVILIRGQKTRTTPEMPFLYKLPPNMENA
ncbi:hypothetical protein AVEN_7476-1 [Araneus ventricosus]|uniref:Uncharacterized protein n=1 Tax=Araneus ventricosus TaxID=182803 RepID=A0A4Y2KVW3_ARAVE|nr:hypothetical protein AVEN_7476-1 [Araneus ventricosus]